MRHSPLIFTISMLIAMAATSCCTRGRYVTIGGYAQGGVYSVRMNMSGCMTPAAEMQDSIDALLARIDRSVSGYNPGSVLSRLNAGGTVVADSIFKELFSMSREWYDKTGGILDVSAGPVFDIWGFGFTTDSLPSPDAVEHALAGSGMDRLVPELPDGPFNAWDLLTDPSDTACRPVLNFNAIAQGYSADKVAAFLRSRGIRDMLVNIGEIYCEGVNPAGAGWTIGVDNPVDGNVTPGADLRGIWQSDGSGCAVVTSGNYRKFYIRDGHKYAHTINPLTGMPVEHGLLSATIVAPDSATADAIATYCMVIGPEEAMKFISAEEGIEGYLICDGGVWTSSGFTLKR